MGSKELLMKFKSFYMRSAIFNHWVGKALHADDLSAASQLGIDEASTRKGQAIGRHFQAKGAQAEQIQQVSVWIYLPLLLSASKLLSLAHRLTSIVSISSSCSIKQWMQCAKLNARNTMRLKATNTLF
jgi:hypothetical protein